MTLSIVIISGQSGSGKSTAIRALEDQGYFCVDNIPTTLVENLIELISADAMHDRLALGIDVRERQFLLMAPPLVQRLRHASPQANQVRLVYLEARDEALIRRYAETRRVHPMDNHRGLNDAIVRERLLLAPLREVADEIFDTSALSPHELRALVSDRIAGVVADENLRVGVVSFGFKYGLPPEAAMVLDVRFLRNPYFLKALQALTGLDGSVTEYVLSTDEAREFVQRAGDLLAFLLPHYKKEGKRRLTVAVGCTGGQHRSVAIAGVLAQSIARLGIGVDVRHRDLKHGCP